MSSIDKRNQIHKDRLTKVEQFKSAGGKVEVIATGVCLQGEVRLNNTIKTKQEAKDGD